MEYLKVRKYECKITHAMLKYLDRIAKKYVFEYKKIN